MTSSKRYNEMALLFSIKLLIQTLRNIEDNELGAIVLHHFYHHKAMWQALCDHCWLLLYKKRILKLDIDSDEKSHNSSTPHSGSSTLGISGSLTSSNNTNTSPTLATSNSGGVSNAVVAVKRESKRSERDREKENDENRDRDEHEGTGRVVRSNSKVGLIENQSDWKRFF